MDEVDSVPVTGGDFLRSLDVSGAAAIEGRRGPSAGMLTDEERGLLTSLVRRTWRGDGAIIDAGSFLGSSLIAEAEGLEPLLRERAPALDAFPEGRVLHGFERGHHPAPSNPAAPRRHTYGAIEIELGESFVPELEANLGPHRDLVHLHIGDLTAMSWGGSPIEIAFVDVCKTPELNAHVSREFYPALIPGGSTLIHQDFFFDQLPWIRVTMGQLADHVTWEGQVGSSSVYRVHRQVPASLVERDPFLDGTLEECLALHDAVPFAGIDRATELMLALSRVELVLAKGSPADALALLHQTAVQYADVAGVASVDDSYVPASGSRETMRPRYRLDRVIGRVLANTRSARPARSSSAPEPTPAPGPSPSPDVRERARAALGRRDYDQARTLLDRPDRTGPEHLLLARTEFEAGDADRAEGLLRDLLERRPRNARARALLGRIHLTRGELEPARDEALTALEGNADLMAARRLLFDLDVATAVSAPVSPGRESGASAG